MAETSVTDDERATRMKALQMADLGTARREHISTVDRPNKLHRIDIQQIEAIRDSNRKGTEAYNLAETNREKLNSWATYHETLEENMDAENLDPLLDGQTHRLALEAKIKGTNLDYPASSSRGKKVTRGALHSGRGGGAAGSRGRGGTSHQLNTRSGEVTNSDPNRLNPPVFTSTKKTLAPLPQKPLDPSKDCNNPPATRGRADRKRYGSSRNLPPVTKARRPVFAAPPNINFESLLADGDDFMAAVAGVQFATVAKPAHPPETSRGPEAPTKSQVVSPAPPVSQECPVPSDNFQKDVPESLQQPHPEVKAVVPSEPDAEAATPATNLKPAAPLRIDVFTNPSEIRDGQGADTVPLKTDHGFGSYLPQPQRQSTDAENHDADDLFLCTSPEAAADAQIEEDKTEGVNIGTSLLDISDGPEDTIPQTQPASQSAPQRVEPKDESKATKEELAKLTKILSNQSLLDPEIVVYLQERKERLEKELVEKELVRNPEVVKTPIYTTEPGNTKPIQSGASNLVALVATSSAPTTANLLSDITNSTTDDVVSPNSSENIKNEPTPVEVRKPEVQNSNDNTFDHNIVYAIPGAFPSKPQTSPHDVPLIIGDHLLPGRPMKKCEPPRPSAPVYEPKQHRYPGTLSDHSNQPSTFNQTHQFHEPMVFTYHATSGGTSAAAPTFPYAPVATSTTGSQPAIITHTAPISLVSPTGSAVPNAPKSRFKMRDTPHFPISAATMQYYSGAFPEEQMKPPTTPIHKTNENINPAMGFVSSQPIEPGQKSGDHSRNQSSSLSPVANTFRPVLQGRSPIPAAFGAPNSGRSATGHHSKFSSTASETPREPKSVFVAEMAKRGVSVSGAPVNNQPVERKRSGMESSKYAH
ncbi:hypothetical protein GTR04_3871 [Trichophyton interdigitale]|nr:hypothetical protein GY631_6927 [Trichophyton interdigitale]KAG5217225.1 hypothetical protein GY632_6763 [Trichophyton interdigitale]KAG8208733.1 hypothetical protein GTR04_3871 [Trichophyton interdigitale]